MSDKTKQDEAPQAQVMPQLVITLVPNSNGGVEVKGAIGDRILAYGMLMSAYEAISQFHIKKQNENRIMVPADIAIPRV